MNAEISNVNICRGQVTLTTALTRALLTGIHVHLMMMMTSNEMSMVRTINLKPTVVLMVGRLGISPQIEVTSSLVKRWEFYLIFNVTLEQAGHLKEGLAWERAL